MRRLLLPLRGLTAFSFSVLLLAVTAPSHAEKPTPSPSPPVETKVTDEKGKETSETALEVSEEVTEPVRRSGETSAPTAEDGEGTAETSPTTTAADNYDANAPAPQETPGWQKSGASEGERLTAMGQGVDSFVDDSGQGWTLARVDGGWTYVPFTADPAEEDPAPEDAPAAEPEPVDVQALAQTAVSQMTMRAPQVASTPDDPDTLGAVGLPVWFWVSDPGPETTGPNTTSATAGDVTVTATATFTGMTIDTGDGNTIECAGPGTEYTGTGIEESPDCGHIYEQMSDEEPDGLYTVTVTAHWEIQWEATTGESGTIPLDLSTDKQLRIGSYQAVVTG